MKNKLWTKDFSLLFSGALVSGLGSYATSVALGFFLLDLTGSTSLMATLLSIDFLVFALVLPFGGLFADFFQRNKLMFFADIIRGVVVLLFAFLVFRNIVPIWFVVITVIFIGLGRGLMNPTVNSYTPDIVKKNNLRRANSFMMLSDSASSIFGRGIGGFLLQTFGAPLLFFFDGLTYLFSGISELFISEKRAKKKINPKKSFSMIAQGFSYLLKHRSALLFVIFAGVSNLFNAVAAITFIPFFDSYFSASFYGLFLAFFGIAYIVGTFIASYIPKKYSKSSFIFSISFWPLAAGAAFFFHSFISISLIYAIAGLFNGISNNFLRSIFQVLGPKELRARVNASAMLFIRISWPVGIFIGGLLSSVFSFAFVIAGSYFVGAFVTILFILFTSMVSVLKVLD